MTLDGGDQVDLWLLSTVLLSPVLCGHNQQGLLQRGKEIQVKSNKYKSESDQDNLNNTRCWRGPSMMLH